MSEETKQRLLQLVSDYGREMDWAGYESNDEGERAARLELAQGIYDRIAALVEAA